IKFNHYSTSTSDYMRIILCIIVNMLRAIPLILFFFTNTATPEIYTLSLHDALPIFGSAAYHLLPDVLRRFRENFPDVELSLRERSEEHTSELQSQSNLVCRLLLEKKKSTNHASHYFDLVIGKILTSRLSLSKHCAHN